MRYLFVQQYRCCVPLCEKANICAYFVSFIMDFVPFLPHYQLFPDFNDYEIPLKLCLM